MADLGNLKLSRERVEYLIAHPEKSNSKIPTMFDLMLNPDAEKGQVTPPKSDMVAEGCLMIAAGTDTTANALGIILFHVTQNPQIEARLVEELKTAMPGRDVMVESARLEGEGFEYMRAVVKEALRLSYGVPGRIIRKTPKEGARFGDTFVPGGVSLLHFLHHLLIPSPSPKALPNLTPSTDIHNLRHLPTKHGPSHLPLTLHVRSHALALLARNLQTARPANAIFLPGLAVLYWD